MPVGLKNVDWSGAHIKHQEWPAQLNRFFHLGALAAAYRATGDEKFPRAARSQIEDWIAQRNYKGARACQPGDNTLNMSIRLGTSVHHGWGGTLPAFLKSPAFDDDFLRRVLESLAAQGRFLAAHLTARCNWRISQLDALVFTALRFPMLAGAPALLQAGIRGMRHALATQFLPDGAHVERTPSYHRWMAEVAANYYKLARLFPEADAQVNRNTLQKSWDYSAQSELFGVNDSIAPARDPHPSPGLKRRKKVLQAAGLSAALPPRDQVFPDAGQVFTRTGFSPGAEYLAFDAGSWGGGHCHLSRLAFTYRAGGRMLVADPGILNYEMSDPLAAYGKSTPAHSTLNVNRLNQSNADADLLQTAFTPETAFIHAAYQGGYWNGKFLWSFKHGHGQGAFGSHQRVLFWKKREYLLVLDAMCADPGATVYNCVQMGPADRWSCDAKRFRWWSGNKDRNLLLQLVMPPSGARIECVEGRRQPPGGWIGRRGNDAVAAPLVEFRYPAGPDTVSAMLLTSYAGAHPPRFKVQEAGTAPGGLIHRLVLRLPDGSTDHVIWSTGLALPVEEGPLASDSGFVWCRLDARGRPARCFLINGSYLEYKGRPLWKTKEKRSALITLPGASRG